MDYAKLEIEFRREYDVTLDNYFLTTTVQPTVSVPIAVEKSLLVVPGSSTVQEVIARVATKAELSLYTVIPATVDRFSSPSLALVPGGIQINDVIKVRNTIPPIWKVLDGVVDGDNYTVTSLISPTEVTVTPVFKSFAKNIYFQVYRSAALIYPPAPSDPYLNDGTANRNYGGVPALYYLSDTHKDWFDDDLDAAMAMYAALEAGAQGLVNEYNRDEYTGTGTEIFE